MYNSFQVIKKIFENCVKNKMQLRMTSKNNITLIIIKNDFC